MALRVALKQCGLSRPGHDECQAEYSYCDYLLHRSSPVACALLGARFAPLRPVRHNGGQTPEEAMRLITSSGSGVSLSSTCYLLAASGCFTS